MARILLIKFVIRRPDQTRMKRLSKQASFTTICLLLTFGFQSFVFARWDNLRPDVKQDMCSYVVTLETTCAKGAGTSNPIGLRFGDTNSNDVLVRHLNTKHVKWVDPLEPQVLDDVPRKPFQACITDEFRVEGRCVESPICYLYLKLTGSDDWRPGFARIRVLSKPHLDSEYFYFRRFLPRKAWHGFDVCDSEVTPFGIKHKRKVF